jgi:sulfite reductase alpha subunit-like flavoprotein
MLGEKDMTLGTVRQHFQVADTSVGPRKMIMDVELPGDVSYQAGDYLVVLPTNHRHNVRRVLQRFDMPVDALVKLSGTKKSFLVRQPFLPTNQYDQLIVEATRSNRVRFQHHRSICRDRHAHLTEAAPAPRLSDYCHDTESRARTSGRDSLRICRPVKTCQPH